MALPSVPGSPGLLPSFFYFFSLLTSSFLLPPPKILIQSEWDERIEERNEKTKLLV